MSILKFLDEASEIGTLIQIRREVYGDAEDADDDDEVDGDLKVQRTESKTLKTLLEKHNGECRTTATDWTCFLDFLKQDFWVIANLDVVELQKRLVQLRDITSYAHVVRSKSYRTNFSSIVSICTDFYMKSKKHDNTVVEKYVRKIVKCSDDSLRIQMQLKQQSLENQMAHPFSFTYYEIQQRVMEYAQLMTVDKNDLTKSHISKFLACTNINVGTRKTEVLDDTIQFYTYRDFMNLHKDDAIQQAVFIGEKGLGVVVDDKVFAEMDMDNVIVQVGKLKDKNQRLNKYLDEDDARYNPVGAIIVKPTTFLSGSDVVKMIKLIRWFFRKHEKDSDRVRIGSRISSRDITPIMENDWPTAVAHAKKFKLTIGTHLFRKFYVRIAVHAYRDIVSRYRGSVISDQTLMAALLGHSGSIFTTMSYSNVVITYSMDAKNFEPDHVLQLQRVVDRLHLMEQKFLDLERRTVAPLPVAEVSSHLGINSYDSPVNDARENYEIFSRVSDDGTVYYTYVHKHDGGRYQGETVKQKTRSRDIIMNNYKAKLESLGLKVNTDTIMIRVGFSKDTVADWKKGLDIGTTRNKPVKSKTVVAPKSVLHVDLPEGAKIITSSTGTENSQNMARKRNIELVGEENVTTAEGCEAEEGRWIKKKVKLNTDKGTSIVRDLCVKKND